VIDFSFEQQVAAFLGTKRHGRAKQGIIGVWPPPARHG